SRGRVQRDERVFVILNAVGFGAGFDMTGPADHSRYAHPTLPSCPLFAAEGRVAAIGPKDELVAIIGGVNHDRIVSDSKVLEFLQDGPYVFIVLNHASAYDILLGSAFVRRHLEVLWVGMGPDVNCRR